MLFGPTASYDLYEACGVRYELTIIVAGWLLFACLSMIIFCKFVILCFYCLYIWRDRVGAVSRSMLFEPIASNDFIMQQAVLRYELTLIVIGWLLLHAYPRLIL